MPPDGSTRRLASDHSSNEVPSLSGSGESGIAILAQIVVQPRRFAGVGVDLSFGPCRGLSFGR
jgi:hypothetical protein